VDALPQLSFTIAHRIGLLAFSFALLLLVLELVRRRRFKERYALLWLAVAAGVAVVGVFPGIIVWISRLIHVQFLSVFFLSAFLFLLGLVLSFSVVISRLSEQNRDLAQEVALLEARVEQMEGKRGHDA
jgi:hypothetical protein